MSDVIVALSNTEEKKTKKRKKWLFLSLFLLIIILIGFFWWLFGRKSYGTIVELPQANELNEERDRIRSSYEGKYITFTYPQGFNRREEEETVKYPILERVYLTQSDIEGRKIAIIVQDIGNSSLEEYSSYRIRQMEPNVYRQGTLDYQGEKVTSFTKGTNGPEVAVFFRKNNKVISAVFSSSIPVDGLEEESERFLGSFAWKDEEAGR